MEKIFPNKMNHQYFVMSCWNLLIVSCLKFTLFVRIWLKDLLRRGAKMKRKERKILKKRKRRRTMIHQLRRRNRPRVWTTRQRNKQRRLRVLWVYRAGLNIWHISFWHEHVTSALSRSLKSWKKNPNLMESRKVMEVCWYYNDVDRLYF